MKQSLFIIAFIVSCTLSNAQEIKFKTNYIIDAENSAPSNAEVTINGKYVSVISSEGSEYPFWLSDNVDSTRTKIIEGEIWYGAVKSKGYLRYFHYKNAPTLGVITSKDTMYFFSTKDN